MRILVTGSFDILHPGHIFIINEAAKLGEVYVIVARDSTIFRIKKNSPIVPENQRLEVVQSIKNVLEAHLGNEDKPFLEKALSLKPDIILLGPNQKYNIDDLHKELEKYDAGHVQIKRAEKMYDKYELNSSTSIKDKIKRNWQ
jgi:FAD synthetase